MSSDKLDTDAAGFRSLDVAAIAFGSVAGGVLAVWCLFQWHFGKALYDTAGVALLLATPVAFVGGVLVAGAASFVTLRRLQAQARGIARLCCVLTSCIILYACLVRTGLAETFLRPQAAEQRRHAAFAAGLADLRTKPWVAFHGGPDRLHLINVGDGGVNVRVDYYGSDGSCAIPDPRNPLFLRRGATLTARKPSRCPPQIDSLRVRAFLQPDAVVFDRTVRDMSDTTTVYSTSDSVASAGQAERGRSTGGT